MPQPQAPSLPQTDEPKIEDVVVKAMGLTKVFKDFWLRDKVKAVNDINFEILRGEVFGLLGPNGSGKSTTIKLILGLLHPTAGQLAVFGSLPRDVGTKKRIGYLPEETYLYKFLNPIETLDYYGKLFHLDRSTRKKRIGMLLDMVGLDHAGHRPVGEFSKGMMRKVGLAQALINDPELLILDEPTSGMDPIATDDVKKVILQLQDRGKTILLCSHLLADVQDVCDRVAMMFGGKIRREGPLQTLLQVQDKTTITTSSLTHISDEQVITALERLGVTDVTLDHPRRTLEQVFLEMVEEAQQQGLQTFGAKSGQEIAAFLQGETEDEQAFIQRQATQEREALLQSLVRGASGPHSTPETETNKAEPAQPAAARPDPQPLNPPTPPAPSGDDGVLAQLTGDTARQTNPKPATPEKPDPPDKNDASKPQADKGVIDDLLNG